MDNMISKKYTGLTENKFYIYINLLKNKLEDYGEISIKGKLHKKIMNINMNDKSYIIIIEEIKRQFSECEIKILYNFQNINGINKRDINNFISRIENTLNNIFSDMEIKD